MRCKTLLSEERKTISHVPESAPRKAAPNTIVRSSFEDRIAQRFADLFEIFSLGQTRRDVPQSMASGPASDSMIFGRSSAQSESVKERQLSFGTAEGFAFEQLKDMQQTNPSITLEDFFMTPNNQDKGPTRRMITRLNLMFPRRSP